MQKGLKAAFLLVDRDIAYLFLDTENAEPETKLVTITIDGVDWSDIENERIAVWLEKDDDKLHIVPRKGFDFKHADYSKTGHPIPTPIVIFDKAEYERREAEAA